MPLYHKHLNDPCLQKGPFGIIRALQHCWKAGQKRSEGQGLSGFAPLLVIWRTRLWPRCQSWLGWARGLNPNGAQHVQGEPAPVVSPDEQWREPNTKQEALWQSQNKSGKSIQETLGVQASQRKPRGMRRVRSCPSAEWGEVRSPGPGHPPSHPQPDRRLLTCCLQGLISSGLVSNEPWHPPESTLITWS